MLTKSIFFGMNLLSLAGFLLMGIGLTMNRQKQIGARLAFALMGAGTALLFLGFYVAVPE